jgi:hypothetical protein
MVTKEDGTCWTCYDNEASGIALPPIEQVFLSTTHCMTIHVHAALRTIRNALVNTTIGVW